MPLITVPIGAVSVAAGARQRNVIVNTDHIVLARPDLGDTRVRLILTNGDTLTLRLSLREFETLVSAAGQPPRRRPEPPTAPSE